MNFLVMKNETLNCELIYIVDTDNEIWFRGKTVAQILGYTNPAKSIRDHIDSDDKLKLKALSRVNEMDPLKHNEKNTIFINESGLYSLILSSKLKMAKKFKRWVTKDVLPTIRKTGEYKVTTLTVPKYKLNISDELNQLEKLISSIEALQVSAEFQTRLKEMLDEQLMNDDCTEITDIVDAITFELKRMDRLNISSKVRSKLMKKLYDQFERLQLTCESDSDSDFEEGALRWINNYS